MDADTYILTFPGALLKCGFWVYVWRIDTAKGEMLYVGRTGDSSSPNATPPYTRMRQHLGNNKNQNALRRQLKPRDLVAAIEKHLADTLEKAGYRVLNKVHCRKPLDEGLWLTVKQGFVEYFPKIGDIEG